MFDKRRTVLVIIDFQEKLAAHMHEKEGLTDSICKLIRGVRALDVPVLWAEQNPGGLGPTVAEAAQAMDGLEAITKMSFSCCGSGPFVQALHALGRDQVLAAGIEAHVCVYQTAVELLGMGYEVEVAADAVSSRTAGNRDIALEKMRCAGVGVTSVETALFELLKVAEGPEFKEILKIVK